MRIGIDFDNTIACYDGVFHAAALERRLIPADLPRDKNSVRDLINGSGNKDAFTELQGYVYGTRMALAAPYPGAIDFMKAARAGGHDLFIVSHKTRFPMLGPQHDLHDAARGFLGLNAIGGSHGLIPDTSIFFELTKEEKQARAATLGVEAFIDDLPEILAMPQWQPDVRRILFDPEGHFPDGYSKNGRFERYGRWADIQTALLAA